MADKKTKKSGAALRIAKSDNKKSFLNGQEIITGWKASKRHGLLKFLAHPTSKGEVVKSKKGNEYETNWACKVTPEFGEEYTIWGLYDIAKSRFVCPDRDFVLSPKSPNGGYAGRMSVPKSKQTK